MIPNVHPDFERFVAPDTTVDQLINWVWREWSGRRNPFIRGTAEWQRFRDFIENKNLERNRRWEDLPDVPVVRRMSKRRMPQPTLKVPFATLHDIQMRLKNTLIFVGSELYYVYEIVRMRNDYLLIVQDAQGQNYKVWYSSPDIDLRSIEPQYITLDGKPRFLHRQPVRVQKQGMSTENLYLRVPGGNIERVRELRSIPSAVSLEVFNWNPLLVDLMVKAKAIQSLRLSKNIAVYISPQDKDSVFSEYRGRMLGKVCEDTMLVDDVDITKPWITEAIRQVGCTPKQGQS